MRQTTLPEIVNGREPWETADFIERGFKEWKRIMHEQGRENKRDPDLNYGPLGSPAGYILRHARGHPREPEIRARFDLDPTPPRDRDDE